MSNQAVEIKRGVIAACMTCPLCNKLLKDATTISLCLHTCWSSLSFNFLFFSYLLLLLFMFSFSSNCALFVFVFCNSCLCVEVSTS